MQEFTKGRIVSILGTPGTLSADRATLLRTHGFPLAFIPEAIAEAEKWSAEPDPKRDRDREDVTDWVCSTIDPEDAKDFDDAITLEPRPNGWLAAVHIADVSFYMPPGCAIDKEAVKRATSVYLPHGAAHMLPDKLSGDLCSLRPNEKRRAVSVICELDEDGKVLSSRIARTWICSRRRFDYTEVQAIFDEYDQKRGAVDRWKKRLKAGVDEPWEARLIGLRWFARMLREDRLASGGIEFESNEARIELGSDGSPIKIAPRSAMESYEVIEEWMLLANRTVTELYHFHTKHRHPFVYRIHEESDEAKVEEFLELAADLGYRWTGGSPFDSKEFARFVASFREAPEAPVLMDLAIRSLKRAVYSTVNKGHYGLGFANYTHFTSPIRRYPDVLVHRLLINRILSKKPAITLPDETELKRLCDHCSKQEQAATETEREGVKWKQVEYLKRFIGKPLDALIVSIRPRGIFVELLATLAQSFIPVERLGNEYLVYYPRRHEIRNRNGTISYRLGDKMRVTVVSCDERRHRFELELYFDKPVETAPTKPIKQKFAREKQSSRHVEVSRSNRPVDRKVRKRK